MSGSTVSAPPILIVGSVAFDDLELPSGNARNVVGGSATYCALASSLFSRSRVVAVVGRDFPESVLEDLRERGVDTSGIERKEGQTFRWAGRYSENLASRTTLSTELNVFADFQPKLPQAFTDTAFVLLGNIHPQLQLDVLEQMRSPRFVAADTMNFWIEGERSSLELVLQRVDALVINDEELRQLSNEHNLRRAANKVLRMGPAYVIVKRGEYGAMLFDESGAFFAPAYPLEDEIDPTGAGDTFAGALIGYLAQQGEVSRQSLRNGLLIAATVASFCVEDVGTRGLLQLKNSAVADRLREIRSLVGVD